MHLSSHFSFESPLLQLRFALSCATLAVSHHFRYAYHDAEYVQFVQRQLLDTRKKIEHRHLVVGISVIYLYCTLFSFDSVTWIDGRHGGAELSGKGVPFLN